MRHTVKLQNVIVGWSDLEERDPAVGRAWGRFRPGVGAALMQHCVDLAASRGRDWIWLGVWERNVRAIAFYSRWGFTDVGSQSFQLGADLQTDRIMARRIAARE